MPLGSAAPPRWDKSALETYREQAIQAFIRERAAEGGQRYRDALAENIRVVTRLLAVTDDLRTLAGGATLSSQAGLMYAARYLGGPPVSADDLNTLAEASVANRKKLSTDLAKKAAAVITAWLDRDRFPWLFEVPVRGPTAAESDIAVRWTAGLMTLQQVQTHRRTEAAGRQQLAVRDLLRAEGFRPVASHPVNVVGDLGRGEYCGGESIVAGTKCDVPVGLRNGRLLLVECKVSNSGTNSVKRLNREVGGKAGHWRGAFGLQAFTAAVLAGVYKFRNLEDAQDVGVSIFWEHDLAPLAAFLRIAV